jgi:zinc transport system substrate-binding protein
MLVRLVLVCGLWAIPFMLWAGQDRLTVYTVNYPLQYFAERIAGDHAEVVFPAPESLDPATWQPSPEVIAGYQEADLILLNGAGYAKWVRRSTLPIFRLVDTSSGFRAEYIHTDDIPTHSHGPGAEHDHGGIAYTTWLDLRLAAEQARAIAAAMTRKRPQWESDLARNLATLEADLSALDRELESVLATVANQPILASHPVYQYLQRRYGLDLESLVWEPDLVPDEAQWSALGLRLKERPARWMIWEGAPHPQSVRRLRAMGVDSIVLDPAANRPDQGDFLDSMRRNIENLRRAFSGAQATANAARDRVP